MSYIDKSCSEFAEILAAGTPVPGGGSAAALVGAVGTALGNMVGSLTAGKKKYAHVEKHMYALMEKAEELRVQLLELVDKDAEAFAPLAKGLRYAKGHSGAERRKAPSDGGMSEACMQRAP